MIQHLNVFSSYDCFNWLVFLCWIISFWIIPCNSTKNRYFFFSVFTVSNLDPFGEPKTATDSVPGFRLGPARYSVPHWMKFRADAEELLYILRNQVPANCKDPKKKRSFSYTKNHQVCSFVFQVISCFFDKCKVFSWSDES